MKMLAQNPDGDTITAQEFAAARQDLTNLLQNPSGYVPEQVSAINERVQLLSLIHISEPTRPY